MLKPLDIMLQVTSEDYEKLHACIGLKHDLHCDHFAAQIYTDLQTRLTIQSKQTHVRIIIRMEGSLQVHFK